jgi:hypothetical protein
MAGGCRRLQNFAFDDRYGGIDGSVNVITRKFDRKAHCLRSCFTPILEGRLMPNRQNLGSFILSPLG